MNSHASPARVVVFVQARMTSTRLPGKVLKEALGRPILALQIERIRKASTVDEVVVITTTEASEDPIVALCEHQGIPVFRGDPLDLLDRHYQAAKEYHADFVAKIPSDCPFSDPGIIDRVLGLWKDDPERYDYVSNYHPATFPDGLDVEGCPFSVLEVAWKEASKEHEREHTFPFIWDQPDRFRIGNVENEVGNLFLTHRWTLDYAEDLIFVQAVFQHFRDHPDFTMSDILRLLAEKPELAEINRRHAGVNWYRNVPGALNTVDGSMYRRSALNLDKSLELLERAKKVIPCATQTLSKGYTQWSVGAVPNFLEKASGAHVTDVDGNEYIDYGMALGPFILGYGDPDVDAAVVEQLRQGTMFTLPSPLEVEVAELLCEVVPCAEMVRFGKNGSDATSAAVKVARAHTGREKIVVCGYHGWQDWYIATTERDAGIPRSYKSLALSVAYNDIASLERIVAQHKDEIAGVIMEPVYVAPPEDGYLQKVREITAREGIPLIFDELFTGFRWSLGGAQEYFGVTPDLACFGKAVANGLPVSVIAGRRELMEHFEDVFFSFTYGGEALSLAAIKATIKKLRVEPVHKRVWELGATLKEGVGELIEKHGVGAYLQILGYPVKSAFNFQPANGIAPLEMKTYFQQECARRGILFIGYHLPSYAHTEVDIEATLVAYDEIFPRFKQVMEDGSLKQHLDGTVVTQIFQGVGDRSAGIAVDAENEAPRA